MGRCIKITDTKIVAPLFAGMEDTLVWSCLQGVMSNIYADSTENPESAAAILGGFSFLLGKPNADIIMFKPDDYKWDHIIMVPQNDEWADPIEKHYQDKARKVTRYAFKKDPDVFDKDRLQSVVDSLSPEYSIQLIDEELYNKCKEISWCYDWVAQYEDYETYKRLGLGVVIFKDGEPVAGASSYSSFIGGIEIQIDTKKEYRRKGLAYISGAKLILECLNRGLYPGWDAHNKESAALAKKLGYRFDREYIVYEISDY